MKKSRQPSIGVSGSESLAASCRLLQEACQRNLSAGTVKTNSNPGELYFCAIAGPESAVKLSSGRERKRKPANDPMTPGNKEQFGPTPGPPDNQLSSVDSRPEVPCRLSFSLNAGRVPEGPSAPAEWPESGIAESGLPRYASPQSLDMN